MSGITQQTVVNLSWPQCCVIPSLKSFLGYWRDRAPVDQLQAIRCASLPDPVGRPEGLGWPDVDAMKIPPYLAIEYHVAKITDTHFLRQVGGINKPKVVFSVALQQHGFALGPILIPASRYCAYDIH